MSAALRCAALRCLLRALCLGREGGFGALSTGALADFRPAAFLRERLAVLSAFCSSGNHLSNNLYVCAETGP